MPHSAGGGSFGGGGHRGGGSGGSLNNGNGRMYRNQQPGMHRYVYYGRNHMPHYFYMRGKGGWSMLSPVWMLSIVGLIFWFIFAFKSTEPLDAGAYASGSVIEDHLGLIKEADVKPAMDEFLNTTGVSPAVEIVTDSEWTADYGDIEDFALAEYERMFNDEDHLLTVISYADDYASNEKAKAKWHLMVGDDCESAIDEDLEDKFVYITQEEMEASITTTLGDSVSSAFQEMTSTWKDTCQSNKEMSAFLRKGTIVVVAIIVLINIWALRKFFIQKNAKRA